MYAHKFSHLQHTTRIQPLNVVRMRVLSCGQAKLLDHVCASKIVATSAIDDDFTGTFLDGELRLEQGVTLILFSKLHLST